MTPPIADWLTRWDLTPDGPELRTPAARLLPVRRDGRPAMLKLATTEEERRGAAMLRWLGPEIAAEVFALDGPALLMARGHGDLAELSATNDAGATAVLCGLARTVHAPGPRPPGLTDLADWCAALTSAAGRARFPRQAKLAEDLLSTQGPSVALHGDLHHGNVLGFDSGWRVIDPKGLWGDPCFDFVQMFYNPDALGRGACVAARPEVFQSRLAQVSETADLDPARLCAWIEAHAALSQCWAAPGDDLTLVTRVAAHARSR